MLLRKVMLNLSLHIVVQWDHSLEKWFLQYDNKNNKPNEAVTSEGKW